MCYIVLLREENLHLPIHLTNTQPSFVKQTKRKTNRLTKKQSHTNTNETPTKKKIYNNCHQNNKKNTNQTKQNIRHTKTGQNTRTLYTCLYTCISLLTYALTLGIIKLLCNTSGPVAFQCIIPPPTPRRWKDVFAHHWLFAFGVT